MREKAVGSCAARGNIHEVLFEWSQSGVSMKTTGPGVISVETTTRRDDDRIVRALMRCGLGAIRWVLSASRPLAVSTSEALH